MELSLSYFIVEIPVRGCDHPYVHTAGCLISYSLKFAFLQNAQ